MPTSLVSFNAARPILFAGTLAVAWLAFSAPSSAADTGPDSGSVLGTISAAASPVTSTASGAADSVGSGPSQSVPENRAGPVGVPVAPLPVVTWLDPAAAVATTIVSPVVDGAAVRDGALQPVADLVTEPARPLGTVIPSPVVDVISPVVHVVTPVVSPVIDMVTPVGGLQPVHDLVTDVAPLHVSDFIPGAVDDHTIVVLSEVSAADIGTAVGSTGPWSTAPLGTLTPRRLLTWPLSTLLVPAAAASSAGPQAGFGAPRGSSGGPGPMPEPMLPPVSGSGSGQSSGGSQTPAAWLSNIFEYLSLPGTVPVSGPLQHVPAPVSFDPGSSPD